MKIPRFPLTDSMTRNEKDWMASMVLGLGMSGMAGIVATFPMGGSDSWLFILLLPLLILMVIPMLLLAIASQWLPSSWGLDFIEGNPGRWDDTVFIALCLLMWWTVFTGMVRMAIRVRRDLAGRFRNP